MKFAIFGLSASVDIRPLPVACCGAPRCHPRCPGPIKGQISHYKYLHVWQLKG